MTDTRQSTSIFLPSFGASIEEGTIISWKVAVGDTVHAGQVLAEIETDKALVELEATDDGVIEAIDVPEGGGPVKVGTAIARYVKSRAEIEPGAEAAPRIASEIAPDAAHQDEHREYPKHDTPVIHRKGPTVSDDSQAPRRPASPRARRLARESGRSVDEISGSGPNGRIVGRDLETVQGDKVAREATPGEPNPAGSARPSVSPFLTDLGFAPGSYDMTPLTGMRKSIARRLSESFRDVPHYSLSVDVELDTIVRVRKTINTSRDEGITLSINDFVIWAAAAALRDVPEANASYTEEGIALHRHANIAVAVAIGGGLVTPVVRAAETKSLVEIATEMGRLADKARSRRLEKAELEGGTFTVSNLGMVGIKSFTSVLNPPQGCILSVGAAEQRPVVRSGKVAIATMATMTLTCDHRAVDGVVGAQFLASFRTHLTTPPLTASG